MYAIKTAMSIVYICSPYSGRCLIIQQTGWFELNFTSKRPIYFSFMVSCALFLRAHRHKRFRKQFSFYVSPRAAVWRVHASPAIFTLPAAESSRRSFRSCANRPILALLPKTSPGYKRGNAFGLDSRTWTYRERGGVSAIIAQTTAHNTSGSGKKSRGERARAGRRAPIPPIELSWWLVEIGLAFARRDRRGGGGRK